MEPNRTIGPGPDVFSNFTTDPFGEFPLLIGDNDYNYWFPEDFSGNIPSGNELMSCLEHEFYSDTFLKNTNRLQQESELKKTMKRKREEKELCADYEFYGFQYLFANEQQYISHPQTQLSPSDVLFIDIQQEYQFKNYITFLKFLYREQKMMPNIVWNNCYIGKNILGFDLLTYQLFVLGAEIVLDHVIIKELLLDEMLS
jgi:hypothetical protein